MIPQDLRYTEEHEWVRLEGDQAVVGITDFAQKKLGDIVFLEPPEVGKELKAGDVLGNLESVKAASDIYAPLGGKVAAVNDELADSPGAVNQDPYGDGWIARLAGVKRAEFEKLLDAAAYAEHIAGEENP